LPDRRLPVRPNLGQLKHQAKDLLRQIRSADPAPIEEFIWRDDVNAVRGPVLKHPQLLHEQALIRTNSNWGLPMSYAANLGRDRIIEMLHELGAADHHHALGRATLRPRFLQRACCTR